MMLVSDLEMGPLIGQGYYGKVYRAIDPVHGEVAVKVLSRRPDESDCKWHARREGLLKEAQRLSAATHRNVVQVYNCMMDSDAESIRFSMKLCAGGSLQSFFDAGPMKLSAVRRIATEVTFGLQALHQRGMLHRDIKPANILLDSNGVALLGDFGWVTDELFLGYAKAGGYLDHLAYEAWHTGVASVKTDIWALGMTLYRLLHGKIWYSRLNTPRYNIEKGGFVDTLTWLPHIPAKWRRVIRQMLADDPGSRFQNCEQLLAAFANLPIDPDWECTVENERILWSREVKKRRKIAIWIQHSDRKHEWSARSEPLNSGRIRNLGGSTTIVSQSTCLAQLRSFFASSAQTT